MRARRLVVGVIAVAVATLAFATLADRRAGTEDLRAADRICEPGLLGDRIEDLNEAEVLEVEVRSEAAPTGWLAGQLPGRRSDVRPVADAAIQLLEATTSRGEAPLPVDTLDRERAELASACVTYRR